MEYVKVGTIIDLDNMKQKRISQKDVTLHTYMSHGVLTRTGVVIGPVFSNKKCIVAYKPDVNRVEIIHRLGKC